MVFRIKAYSSEYAAIYLGDHSDSVRNGHFNASILNASIELFDDSGVIRAKNRFYITLDEINILIRQVTSLASKWCVLTVKNMDGGCVNESQ